MRGYQDERWGTYRQIQEAGGRVRRGQKGASVVYWQWEARRLARDGKGKPLLDDKAQPVYEVKPLERPRSYMYTIFNAEQANGLPPRPLPEAEHQWEQNERVEKLIKNCGVALEHATQDRVFYDMGRDVDCLAASGTVSPPLPLTTSRLCMNLGIGRAIRIG